MISTDYVKLMARYNAWQNQSLYGAATTLSDAQRREDKGAFWKSIHGTLSHLLWADQLWMTRFGFDTHPRAPSNVEALTIYTDFAELQADRFKHDAFISNWAAHLTPADLEGDLVWTSRIAKGEFKRPRWVAITHIFNHQTHHRGQVHALLTSFGAKPDATDIAFMPDA
ncbi:DinB family protein [Aestuariivirga litoralis]|uniref:DinB family protein n=1 Tax=Aestuariivirga litoralis TaxID=2650924 RepID=UPI0018C7E358|nr:DinB family protein [Aestuariivirga litoralis]MBG1231126.1 damage-inducible protein DinB [Aestuariivirga litoralis]